MNTLSYKTQSANKATVEQKWYVVDAEGKTLGRLCSKIAHVLRGKHKPSFTPHVDCGDHVIVLNAEKIRLTGDKIRDKVYLSFSGYMSGQKSARAEEVLAKKPTALVEMSVKGMLPKNKLGAAMFSKLHAYEGTAHPHEAQKPEEMPSL